MMRTIVLIGASAGGPNSILKILSGVKGKLHFPVVIAVHTMASQIENLASLIKKNSDHEVVLVKKKEKLRNAVYLPEGGKDIILISNEIVSISEANSNITPSIDKLFSSVKNIQDARLYIFLLGGLGNDGVKALEEVETLRNIQIYIQNDAKFPYIPLNAMKKLSRYQEMSLSEMINEMDKLNFHQGGEES